MRVRVRVQMRGWLVGVYSIGGLSSSRAVRVSGCQAAVRVLGCQACSRTSPRIIDITKLLSMMSMSMSMSMRCRCRCLSAHLFALD